MDKHEIRLCIIDDVDTVAQGIARKIPWAEHGITVSGTAGSGAEGLELIRRTRPHIILTDIKMPRMSGLEMIRALAAEPERQEQVKVIFLSGYSDFEYAQESVRLGAFDYVLKPFTPPQIVEVVLRARRELEEERLQAASRIELERKVRESMPYLRQEYFRLLLRSSVQPAQAQERWAFLGITMRPERLTALLIEIDGFAEAVHGLAVGEAELVRFAVHNIIQETIGMQTQGIVFREQVHQFVAIANSGPGLDTEAIAEQCRANVERYAKRTVSIGVGREAPGLAELHVSFEQARTALSYQFYTGGNCVLHYRDIERQSALTLRYDPDKETELLYALRSGNREGVQRQLHAIYEEALQLQEPPEPAMLVNLFYGLAFAMYRVVAEKLEDEERARLEARLAALKLGESGSIRLLKHDLEAIALESCAMMQQRQKSDSRQLIEQARAYIARHLLTELTVQQCAKAVHLSPSYFSNLFKKETGSTFMQYVTAARMERAKELLLEGEQVQEIAYELGYKDRPYFSELFKRHTGLTPSEFRAQHVTDAHDS
ncbi:helix-turn-helix domain-containing protein [Paenibacillus sp. IB182496]|uniref:Helix-turn-helix domain-containing protein n=1 Tax=Paenibacillus sabuli TaxID=2772509 RepID=A0A927GQP4_9BACL|nr:helix-turn-helix domain-containing protein [Paenibacillus sabuli]MBD2844110.1 helix-turn-helix domain-containing protein [Paenibacillus sabuli]